MHTQISPLDIRFFFVLIHDGHDFVFCSVKSWYSVKLELFDSTESPSSELKDIWRELNANVEETADLTNKVT